MIRVIATQSPTARSYFCSFQHIQNTSAAQAAINVSFIFNMLMSGYFNIENAKIKLPSKYLGKSKKLDLGNFQLTFL